MQVVRLLEPRNGRTLAAKLRKIVRAVEIERILTKDQIVSLYLELAPYGGNIEGVRAASLAYFGKEPRRLTLGEAALLVALPQSPEARRPDRAARTAAATSVDAAPAIGSDDAFDAKVIESKAIEAGATRRARDRVLDRVAAVGIFSAAEIDHAKAE